MRVVKAGTQIATAVCAEDEYFSNQCQYSCHRFTAFLLKHTYSNNSETFTPHFININGFQHCRLISAY